MPAFLILAHRSAAILGDLFRYIYTPHGRYLLHIDRKAPIDLQVLARGLAAAFPNAALVESRDCSWGGYSLVAATRNAITLALAYPGFGHFIILSEQHVPLVPGADIAAALRPGVSDIQMQPAQAMVPVGQADVMDRFAWHYRELPGVGMFATSRRRDIPGFEIYHGSQWIILDEELCRKIATATDDIWELFASSLLADETALQTITGMVGMENSGRNRTWVATPERIGDHSIMLGAAHIFAARQEGGFLFARKRPDELPGSVGAALEAQAAFTPSELSEILRRQAVRFHQPAPAMTASELCLHLRWHLNRLMPDLTIEALSPPVNAPACYIRVASPGALSDVSLSLLSENMRHFKILLAWHKDFDDAFSNQLFRGLPTRVIRARIYGLAYQREIHPPDVPDFRFVELADPSDVSLLVRTLRLYLTFLQQIADQTIPQTYC